MRTKNSRSLLLLFVLCVIPALALAQRYTVTDLGPLAPTGINSWAQVVGNYNGHAFIWARGQGMRDLGLLSSGTFSQAAAVNDLGLVVGTADGAGTVVVSDSPDESQQCSDLTQPFVWTQKNGMQGLGTIPFAGGAYSIAWCDAPYIATGTNILGQVVGFNDAIGSTYQEGFLWTRSNGMSFVLGNWPPSSANSINDFGQVVGQQYQFPGLFTLGLAATWKHGIMTFLPTFSQNLEPYWVYLSAANSINNRGQIVGWSTTTPEPYVFADESPVHAVLWTTGGGITDLGTLTGDTSSAASRINVVGQVIGSSGNATTEPDGSARVVGRPFIWTKNNPMRDLNTLIPAASGWVLQSAADINVWGQIVGQGTKNGQPHGYLLTPLNPFQVF